MIKTYDNLLLMGEFFYFRPSDFIQFIVLPIIELWNNFIQSRLSDYMVKRCIRNLHVWQSRNSFGKAAAVRKPQAVTETKPGVRNSLCES